MRITRAQAGRIEAQEQADIESAKMVSIQLAKELQKTVMGQQTILQQSTVDTHFTEDNHGPSDVDPSTIPHSTFETGPTMEAMEAIEAIEAFTQDDVADGSSEAMEDESSLITEVTAAQLELTITCGNKSGTDDSSAKTTTSISIGAEQGSASLLTFSDAQSNSSIPRTEHVALIPNGPADEVREPFAATEVIDTTSNALAEPDTNSTAKTKAEKDNQVTVADGDEIKYAETQQSHAPVSSRLRRRVEAPLTTARSTKALARKMSASPQTGRGIKEEDALREKNVIQDDEMTDRLPSPMRMAGRITATPIELAESETTESAPGELDIVDNSTQTGTISSTIGSHAKRGRGRTGSNKSFVTVTRTSRTSIRKVKVKTLTPVITQGPVLPHNYNINPEEEVDFIPDHGSATDAQQKTYTLRQRSVRTKKTVVVVNTSGNQQKPAQVAQSKQPSVSSVRVSKVSKSLQRAQEENTATVKLSENGILTVRFTLRKHIQEVNRRLGPKRIAIPRGGRKDFFLNARYDFNFGFTRFAKYPQIALSEMSEICTVLRDDLAKIKVSIERSDDGDNAATAGIPQGPMHAADSVTVDSLVKIMISQATNNDIAIAAQAKFSRFFPFYVDGQRIVKKVPDYHAVRIASKEKLQSALRAGGQQNERSKALSLILEKIRQINQTASSPGCEIAVNPTNSAEFVPGSLSLDFTKSMTKEEKMHFFLSLERIGVKSAACMLAFAYGLDVFAVDVHVFRLTKWLGWFPKGVTKEDEVCCHLDFLIPDNLKFGLHQGFWWHGVRCLRCRELTDRNTPGWDDTVCVLEKYLTTDGLAERAAPKEKKRKETQGTSPVQNEPEDRGSPALDDAEEPKPSAKKRKRNSPSDEKPTPRKRQPTKKKLAKVAETMTVEEAADQGYALCKVEKYDLDGDFGVGHVDAVWEDVWMKEVTKPDGTVEILAAEVAE